MKYLWIVCLAFFPLWSFEADELEAKLFAVHATRILPEKDVLRAGFGGKEALLHVLPLTLVPERCTVHFALGELVRPLNDAISWEDCPYAVVIPLADLTPQLINLNCYDTFVIGDVALSERATLVIPIDQAITPYAKIFTYDPATTTLRQAVDSVIAEQQGFAIRMSADDGGEMQPALLDGQNVNTADFFAPLVQRYPYVVVGNRYSMDAEGSPGPHILGEIEGSFIGLLMYYLPLGQDELTPISNEQLFQTRERLITQLEKELYEYLNPLPISYTFTKAFNVYSYGLWLEITKKDLEIRKEDGRTLMQAPPFIWKEIGQINLQGKIALELSRIVDKYKNDLPLLKQ